MVLMLLAKLEAENANTATLTGFCKELGLPLPVLPVIRRVRLYLDDLVANELVKIRTRKNAHAKTYSITQKGHDTIDKWAVCNE